MINTYSSEKEIVGLWQVIMNSEPLQEAGIASLSAKLEETENWCRPSKSHRATIGKGSSNFKSLNVTQAEGGKKKIPLNQGSSQSLKAEQAHAHTNVSANTRLNLCWDTQHQNTAWLMPHVKQHWGVYLPISSLSHSLRATSRQSSRSHNVLFATTSSRSATYFCMPDF